ncbi:FxsA family protein [Desulfovibrio cuneatus]|uniref:FxsA family protein n=1 Tax=Desulfovibrio cuneatus TaxID=159728 RepID=UPI000415DF43|nr:FxsA family protein [Desulfovibrio cuneatus]
MGKLLLVLGFPLLELYTLILLGRVIPGLAVLGLVVLAFFVGGWLLQQQGRQAFVNVQAELAQGKVPHEVLLENLLLFAAGVLFIFPGVISDCIALALLVPPLRQWLAHVLVRRAAASVQQGGNFGQGSFFFYSSSSSAQKPAQHEVVIDCVADEEALRQEANGKGAGPATYDCAPLPEKTGPEATGADDLTEKKENREK